MTQRTGYGVAIREGFRHLLATDPGQLLARALGPRVVCVFVDNGLLRSGERAAVAEAFGRHSAAELRVVDAEERFLDALRNVVDPLLASMLMPRCQSGIVLAVLMPPLLKGHVLSETHAPSGVVVNVVPPTTVMNGSSDGAGTGPPPKSPEAWKKDCP